MLPDCSPHSDRWMSELDNTRGRRELGFSYTPVAQTLNRIVAHHETHASPVPRGYARRPEELALAALAGGLAGR